jgi:hypothetical protein
METNLIKKIFNDYYGEEFDLYGLKVSLYSIYDESELDFRFIFKNPNDVSYYDSIIEEHLLEIVEEFSNYLSIDRFKSTLLTNKEQKEFYLNNELRSKIQKVFDEINHIEFSVNESYTVRSKYKIYGESTGMELHWGTDNFSIDNKFKPTHATLDGEETDISQAISMYNFFLEDKATYWESEEIYYKLDSILLESDFPLLSMDGYVAYYDTKFV